MPATLTVLDGFFGPLAAAAGIRHGVLDTAKLFTVGLARWLPIIALAPYLGGRLVLGPVKVGIAILLTLFVLPGLSHQAPLPLAVGPVDWWILLLRELAFGTVLGIAAGLIIWGAEMGGAFLDTVRGGTVATALVPQMQTQSSVLGNFYFQLFLVLFLTVGGHRLFLGAIFSSYEILPPFDTAFRGEGLAASFITASAQAFVVAAKLIAPALVVVMFLDVALGLANRLAPQFNVFFLSLPLKSAAALLVIGLSLYYMVDIGRRAFEEHHGWLMETLHQMGASP